MKLIRRSLILCVFSFLLTACLGQRASDCNARNVFTTDQSNACNWLNQTENFIEQRN